MRTLKIKLKPKDIKKKAFVHTPEHLPKLHTLTVVAGSRGSGKTYSTTNLIRFYKKAGLVDRCIIISPTAASNKIFYEDLLNSDDDILTEMNGTSIMRATQIIEQESQEYNEYLENKRLYEIWQRFMKHEISENELPEELLMRLIVGDDNRFAEMVKPVWKYKDDSRPPLIFVIIDDAQGSPLLKGSGALINFAIKHRHIGTIGCSLFILTQSYISVSSCPRCIRENATCILLFRVRDEKLKQQLAEECTPVYYTPNQFLEAFNYATKDSPHDFLMCDYSAEKDRIFRKGFNEYLMFD